MQNKIVSFQGNAIQIILEIGETDFIQVCKNEEVSLLLLMTLEVIL